MFTSSLYQALTYIILVSTLVSCAGYGERFAEEEILNTQSLTWSDLEPIFQAECVGCHDDPPKLGAPQSLRTYDEVAPWLNRIKVRSLELRDMPPGGLRTEGAELLLNEWINQGAPFATDNDTAGDIVEPNPTWTTDIYPLFEIYCNTCHADPPTGGAPFPLKTYDQAQSYLDRFQIRILEQQDMPPGGISDPNDLDQIQAWLDAGAPQ